MVEVEKRDIGVPLLGITGDGPSVLFEEGKEMGAHGGGVTAAAEEVAALWPEGIQQPVAFSRHVLPPAVREDRVTHVCGCWQRHWIQAVARLYRFPCEEPSAVGYERHAVEVPPLWGVLPLLLGR
jgi:hypothetical protein